MIDPETLKILSGWDEFLQKRVKALESILNQMAAAFFMQYPAEDAFKDRKTRKEKKCMPIKLDRKSALVRKVLITFVNMVECNHISLPKPTV